MTDALLSGAFDAGTLGWLSLTWSKKGITQIDFLDAAPDPSARAARIPKEFEDLLTRYAQGDDVDPVALPVDFSGTPFQERVWSALRRIPRGQLLTYGALAVEIRSPQAVRAVGGANGKNPIPIVVPCHRVVEQGDRLGGFSAGLDRKKILLALEGIRVVGEKVVRRQLAFGDQRVAS